MKKEKKVTAKGDSAFDFRSIISFEKACEKDNTDPTKLPDVSMLPQDIGKDLMARYKLIIIFKAVNNGWIAKADRSQPKWFAFFYVRSSGSGFDFSYSYCSYALTITGAGLRLCTETEAQIRYITTQFTELFEDMLLNKI